MLNIAVIGAGAIGRIHARNLARHAGARLSAVYDINPEAAVTVAEEHGASAATSLDDALGDTMDAVIIASSTASQARSSPWPTTPPSRNCSRGWGGGSPRADALAMTRRESALPHGSVIARKERSEGRGNPSCPE